MPALSVLHKTLAYSDILKDHLARPRNAGQLDDANTIAERSNPICGDRIVLSLRICEGRIEAAKFLAYGCAPTLACGSALTEMIEGKTRAEAARITRQDLARVLAGLPSGKQHAAALAIEVLHAALAGAVARP
jgi:NifU-like protein involved in Fe-S cluster formation